jgi:hypothetical protein
MTTLLSRYVAYSRPSIYTASWPATAVSTSCDALVHYAQDSVRTRGVHTSGELPLMHTLSLAQPQPHLSLLHKVAAGHCFSTSAVPCTLPEVVSCCQAGMHH